MSGLLEGRIAAVTGGGSGIGRAIALGYAREGAHVVVLDVINVETATQSQKAIRDAGSKAWSLKLDVTDRDACRKVASEIGETIVMADGGYRSI
jgi:3-oxoacyl-[acyl-carrier protein] reductase